MRKLAFCICENKDAHQLCGNRTAVTSQLISAFVATQIEQYLYFLNPKLQASSLLLWLYSLVCVGHGPNTRRPVSHNEAQFSLISGILKVCSSHSKICTKRFYPRICHQNMQIVKSLITEEQSDLDLLCLPICS